MELESHCGVGRDEVLAGKKERSSPFQEMEVSCMMAERQETQDPVKEPGEVQNG